MKLPRQPRLSRVVTSFLMMTLTAWGAIVSAQSDDFEPGFIHRQAAEVPYETDASAPGLGRAILSGDPGAEGVYVIRLQIPPGHTFPPHYHDQDRHVTVISGTWAFGRGDSGRCEDTIPMSPGAYVFHPKGAIHFDGSCGDEIVEVQVIGVGPVTTTRIDTAN